MLSSAAMTTPRPSQRPYRPYGAALTMFYCKDHEILMDGPAGTGKTRGILEKVHLCLCKYPGARALAVRKTRASMTHSVLVTYEEKVLPERSPIKDGPSRAQRQAYTYPNGSELVIGGMDNADRIMSTEFDLIVCFEWTEGTEDDHEKLTTRLRNGVMPYQQLIADCNPSYPSHWLNLRCERGQMTRLLSRHQDNPSVTPEYLATLGRLSGARKSRLLDGVWAAQDGMVYEEWDPAIHLIARMPDGWERWTKYRSIDFGFTNPFVCQWWAEDPDGRLYMYREIYMTRRTVAVHAVDINLYSKGEHYAATIADHDAEDRATLEEAGIYTTPASKAVRSGIDKVIERLKPAADGRPRLFIVRDCLVERDERLVAAKKPWCTAQEIDGYVWPKGKPGKNEDENPVKENDHGMDPARYMVVYRDGMGEFGL